MASKDNENFAIKLIDKIHLKNDGGIMMFEYVRNEIKAMAYIDSEFVVKLANSFETD
jgi:hypothetical protein